MGPARQEKDAQVLVSYQNDTQCMNILLTILQLRESTLPLQLCKSAWQMVGPAQDDQESIDDEALMLVDFHQAQGF